MSRASTPQVSQIDVGGYVELSTDSQGPINTRPLLAPLVFIAALGAALSSLKLYG